MDLSFGQLEKALSARQTADKICRRYEHTADIELIETARSGTIQNFKVAYEQSWKLLKRWMEYHLGAWALLSAIPKLCRSIRCVK